MSSRADPIPRPFTIHWAAAAAILCLALLSFSNNAADVDLWGNTGFVDQWPWQDGFHYSNTFSYTCPDAEWINHEWGAEYLMNLSYRLGGGTGLLIQKLLLGFCILCLMVASARKHCQSGAALFICLALTVSAMGYGFSTRPHHYTFLCLSWFLYVLQHHPQSKIIWTLPAVGFLWSNLHGAFFIGILLLLFAAVASLMPAYRRQPSPRLKPGLLLLVAGAFFVASLINPYGIHLWDFVFHTAGVPRPYLSEWAPLNLVEHFSDHTDFIALVILAIISIALAGKPRNPVWITLLLITLLAAFAMRRNILLFSVTAGFLLPGFVDRALGKRLTALKTSVHPAILTSLLCLSAILSLWFSFAGFKNKPLQIEVDPEMFPVQMITFLKEEDVEANVLVFWDWAEQAIWHLHPRCKVFIDGRLVSAYETDVITDYLNFIYDKPGAGKALNQYATDMVLIHRQNPAYTRMLQEKGWSMAIEDTMAALFVKEDVHGDWLQGLRDGGTSLPPPSSQPLFP